MRLAIYTNFGNIGASEPKLYVLLWHMRCCAVRQLVTCRCDAIHYVLQYTQHTIHSTHTNKSVQLALLFILPSCYFVFFFFAIISLFHFISLQFYVTDKFESYYKSQ